MKRTIIFWVSVMFLSWFLIGSPAFAQKKDKERPPGWDKGEKKGWQSDVPPGQEKKQDISEEEGKIKKEKKEKKKKAKEKKAKEEIEEGKKKEKKEGFWERWFGKGKEKKGE